MAAVRNAVVAALLVGAAMGVGWVFRPRDVVTWPTYAPTPHAVPYDTQTFTPETLVGFPRQ